MKLVKIFGAVMAVHAAVFMFVFAIPGCRSTGKKPASATAPTGAEVSPLAAADATPVAATAPAPSSEIASIRFSPTRPGTPVAAEVTAAPAAAADASYTVVKGDNLWSIAKKHGITVKQLTAANNLRGDSTLKLGQKLAIPGKAPVAVPAAAAAALAPAAPAPSKSAVTHTVKSGETLGAIARKYQVKVGDIAAANNIADPTKIRVGQELKIPGAASSAKAPAKPAATAVAPAKSTAPAAAPVAAPAPAPVAPASPLFSSPLAPAAPATESPLIAPAPATDAPLIRVEESGAPRIE